MENRRVNLASKEFDKTVKYGIMKRVDKLRSVQEVKLEGKNAP